MKLTGEKIRSILWHVNVPYSKYIDQNFQNIHDNFAQFEVKIVNDYDKQPKPIIGTGYIAEGQLDDLITLLHEIVSNDTFSKLEFYDGDADNTASSWDKCPESMGK